jgi:hypothetical protein
MRSLLPAAVVVLLSACTTPDLSGIYAGGLQTNDGDRQVRIHLKQDGTASVQAFFPDVPSRLYAEGTWQKEQDRIVIDLAGERPGRLVFSRSGAQLVGRDWDHALWGEQGPGVLRRVFHPPQTL